MEQYFVINRKINMKQTHTETFWVATVNNQDPDLESYNRFLGGQQSHCGVDPPRWTNNIYHENTLRKNTKDEFIKYIRELKIEAYLNDKIILHKVTRTIQSELDLNWEEDRPMNESSYAQPYDLWK